MALIVKDRVKETTTTTGTGTYTLGGAVTGFETFTSNLSNADTTYYVCTDGTDFEVGIGTFTSSGTTLARTTILASSNSNNEVNWTSGTREIFITYPADKSVFKDASNNINGTFVGNITGNVTGNADTATVATTVTITDNENTNEDNAIIFTAGGDVDGGNLGLESDGDLTYNPSTGRLTATQLAGTLQTAAQTNITSVGTLASDLNMGGQDVINAGVSSADTHAGIYGSSSAPIEFTVTVGTKTAAHPYYGDGSSLAYFINGVESPALTLHGVDNVTSNSEYYYRFTLSSSDMSSHPFRLYLDADKTTAYTTGVTTTSTYLQIAVNEDTPNILYYQCSSHGYMGNHAIVLGSNKINHTEALLSFPTTTGTLVGTGDTGSVSNTMLAGSIANDKLAGSIANAKLANSSITVSDGSTSTAVALGGTVTFAGTSNEVEVGESSGTITVGLPNDVTIAGNLTVNGTTTTIDTTNTLVKDSLLGLNNGASSNSNDSGIIIERGSTGNDALFIWDESEDKFALGTTTDNASSTGNLNMTTGTLVANIEGNVTGNLTGTASIATTVTISDNESTNEDNAIIFTSGGDVDGGNIGLESDGTLTYNPSTGKITATGFIGALTGNADTATALATGRTIAMTGDVAWTSASFDGSGNVTGTATIQAGAVETAMLEDDAVDADKLASNAVVNASVASGAAIAFSKMENLTTGRALVSDGSGDVSVATTTSTEIGYVNGVTSAIQTQLDAKASKGFATAMAIAL